MGWDAGRTSIDAVEKDRHDQAAARLAPPILELEAEDYAADPTTTGVFALDGTATGYLHASNDVDWFAITVEAGDHIEILTDGQTEIEFYDAAGQLVAPAFFNVHDYSGPGMGYVYYGFNATATATYYVAATGGSLRNYTLTATVSDTIRPLDFSLTPVLTNGVAVTGTHESLRDDWFQIHLGVGQTIALLNGGSSTILIYDGNGDWVSNTVFTAALAGTYYVNIYGAAGQNFSVTPHIYFDDYGDFYENGGEVRGTINPVNGSASGVLEVAFDTDLLEMTLTEQQTVRIVLTPTSGAIMSGMMVELLGPDGTSYYGQVNAAPGVPAELLFSAPTAGTYAIVVEAFGAATGAYTIAVTGITDDYSSANPGAITGGVLTGQLESALDVDRFEFAGVAGQVLRLEMQHLSGGGGFTGVPTLYGPNGVEIEPSFVSQLGEDLVLFRLPATGTYSLDVFGSTFTLTPFQYTYDFSFIPDFAIPAALDFLVPENFALWTALPDPGPVPVGPPQPERSVGQLDGTGLPIPETLNFTIEDGEVYFISNNATIAVNTQIDQFPALGMGGNAFTNHGTLWIENSLYPSMGVVYTFTDFYNTGTIFVQSWNAATGTRLAAAVFTNEGDIIVFSEQAYAVGVQLEYTPGGAINTGRIYAVAHSFFASGVQIGEPGGEFYNYGEIYAAGMGGATGISFSWGGTVINEGSIIAEYGGDLPSINGNGAESHGIHNGQVFPLYVYNSGLIQADIAISTYGTPLHVINEGVIRGDIDANGDEGAGSADTLYNDGLIDGDIFLGEGQDLYDGRGTITGALYLGDGDDAAVGGYDTDRFHGGNGNDILDGWLGDDALHGEAGDDSITGGDGIDRSMYQLASTAASWHRNANGTWTVTSADGTDTTTGVEFLDFTDRDVFLDRASSNFSTDGVSDLFLRNSSNGGMVMWFNGNAATSAYLGTLATKWANEGFGDFNGDGRDDLLWRDSTNGNVSMWFMNNNSVVGTAGLGVGTAWSISGIGDLNGDNCDDIVLRSTNGDLVTWFMNGSVISGAYMGNVSTAWQIEILGDFNGDGRDDFIWRNGSTGDMSMWLMNGTAVTPNNFANVGGNWNIAGVGDLNGDGRDDVVWRDQTTGNTALWFMNGGQIVSQSGFNVSSIYSIADIGDFNGDGRDDIMWRSSATNDVFAWFMNGGAVQGSAYIGNLGGAWIINPGG